MTRERANFAWKQCDGGRIASTIYPTLKGRWVTRNGMRFKLVQDCVVRAVSIACSIPYDDAFRLLDADTRGAVLDYPRKVEGRTINGWHIGLFGRWPGRMTRFEFPKLFPTGRFLCSEHGENHLVAYIDDVRYDEGLPPKAWCMTRTWALTRSNLVAEVLRMTAPARIQRKRTRGWRIPANTICVTRPSKWGSPFEIGRDGTRAEVLAKYRAWIVTQPHLMAALPELRGMNLACWCRPSERCHAEVLIELANGGTP